MTGAKQRDAPGRSSRGGPLRDGAWLGGGGAGAGVPPTLEPAGPAGGGGAVDEGLEAGPGVGQLLVGLSLGVDSRRHFLVEVSRELGDQGVDDLGDVDALLLGDGGEALAALEGAAEVLDGHAQ